MKIVRRTLFTVVSFIFMLDCAMAAQAIVAEHSNQHYTKPSTANQKITGTSFPYTLWYDSSKWHVQAHDSDLFEKFRTSIESKGQKLNDLIIDQKKELFVCVVDASNVPHPYEKVLEQLSEGAERNNLDIVACEYRKVNNTDILYIKSNKKNKNLEFVSPTYFFSNSKGQVKIIAMTTQKIFNQREQDLFGLLNGIEGGIAK